MKTESPQEQLERLKKSYIKLKVKYEYLENLYNILLKKLEREVKR